MVIINSVMADNYEYCNGYKWPEVGLMKARFQTYFMGM